MVKSQWNKISFKFSKIYLFIFCLFVFLLSWMSTVAFICRGSRHLWLRKKAGNSKFVLIFQTSPVDIPETGLRSDGSILLMTDNLITLIINLTISFKNMLKYHSKKACLDCCNFFDIHQFIDFHDFHRLCIKSILFWNVQGKVHP